MTYGLPEPEFDQSVSASAAGSPKSYRATTAFSPRSAVIVTVVGARLLAMLLGLQAGLPALDFGGIRRTKKREYIAPSTQH